MGTRKQNGPGAAATARRAGVVASRKPTRLISSKALADQPIVRTAHEAAEMHQAPRLLLFELPKRGGITLRVALTEYCGSRFLDFREWAERDGQPFATRKGVTVPLEALGGPGRGSDGR